MARQALVLMRAGQVCQVVTAYTTLGAGLACCLQRCVLWGLQAPIRLQEDAIHSTAQGVLRCAWGQRMLREGRRWLRVVLRLWWLWLLRLRLWWLLPAF